MQRIIANQAYRIPPLYREELEQEVLIQIWQAVNRDGFDREGGFWGFVQVVSARRCIDWMRRKREQPSGMEELEDQNQGTLEKLIDHERRQVAREALTRMGPVCQELIRLRVSAGKSYAEIAKQLGGSESSLRAQMYRCIGKARSYVDSLE